MNPDDLKAIPPEFRATFERHLLFHQANIDELDGAMMSALSETSDVSKMLELAMAFWPIRFDLIASGWEPDVHSVDLGYIEARLEEQIEQAMESAVKFLSVLSDIPAARRDEYSSTVRAKLQGKKYEWMARARRTRALRLSKTAEVREQRAAQKAHDAEVGHNGRRGLVDDFLRRVSQHMGAKVTRTMIWKAANHKASRQFEYWQKSDANATPQDDKNFRRILRLSPAEFAEELKKKRLI